MRDFDGQTALVTGAGRGIGFAVAQELANGGAKIVIGDVDDAALAEASLLLPDALTVRMDVTSEPDIEAAIAAAMERFGRIDVLVNNAGINSRSRLSTDQFAPNDWDAVMNTNCRGVFLVSRAVVAIMIRQASGRIINIASVTGLVPTRLQCAYNAAKAGVINLTRTMAIEFAHHGIWVNCVAPGSTLTAMTKDIFYGENPAMAQNAQRLIDHIPAGRVGTVEEVAHAVRFFALPTTTYVTGQILCVDGGWTVGGYLRDF
ncbi:3-oxoacyl-[acyl-carrier protein] reductase [Bradyrhizobium sp. S3.12.5]|uniref:SDR family NAD(P)-dependent oxidoreductase n=1 Tax=Bradyrhizobium sp. S3.12.5 TaxID=3156386 RepID=UPI003399A0E8